MEPIWERYLVKNLRGVVYFSTKLNVERELDWLKRKFRYRDLGISEALELKQGWKRLVKLPKIEDDASLDSILQASRFLCPLIVLGHESLGDFGKAMIARLSTRERLDDRALKFNLRLVDYAITDFYKEAIELGMQRNLRARRELAMKDLKRFWRVEAAADGRILIAYLDPLLLKELKEPIFMSIVPCFVLDLKPGFKWFEPKIIG
jgi:hypothetical protein